MDSLKVILVLTCGRTGSTLLVEILKSLGMSVGACKNRCEHGKLQQVIRGLYQRKGCHSVESIEQSKLWPVAKGWKLDSQEARTMKTPKNEAIKIFTDETSNGKTFVYKSPMLFYTMAFWRDVLKEMEIPWGAIISTRDRETCSSSMDNSWSGYIGGKGGAKKMYDYFTETAPREVTDVPHTTVRFEDLLSDHKSVIAKIGEDLGIEFLVDDLIMESIASRIKPETVKFT